jgi:maleamate amidohydrolase
VYSAAGFGERVGFGKKPALLIIDVTYNFVGDKPEPILDSIKRFHNSTGEEGWQSVHAIQQLLPYAREASIPIFYSTGKLRGGSNKGPLAGHWATKNPRSGEEGEAEANRIVDEIAPQPQDIVIGKDKPSFFFGTPLLSHLIYYNIDTLLICGVSTSGCVRATTVDAFSYNYRVAVIEECTFDRGQTSHKINLFDMDSKYADVLSISEVIEFLKALPREYARDTVRVSSN